MVSCILLITVVSTLWLLTNARIDVVMRYHLSHAKRRLVSMLHGWAAKLPSVFLDGLQLPPLEFTEVDVKRLKLDGQCLDEVPEGGEEDEEEDEEYEDIGVEPSDRYGPDFHPLSDDDEELQVELEFL